jgi:endoglucanase
MDSTSHDFLRELLNTPSPSGYEEPVQKLVREYVQDFADEVRTDSHGNVITVMNPAAPMRVMFAGHADQIGLIVQYIDDEGFLYVRNIGGWDPQVLLGQRMSVWSDSGPHLGIIARKPIHLLTDEERKRVVELKDLWIDIGASSREEADELVRVGDAVTVELGYHALRNGLACAPAMDNKTGLWVVLEAMRRLSGESLNCALYSVSTVQEEIGLRGATTSAFGVDPHVAVAVDVTHATDCPTIDKKREGDIRLGAGPVIYRGPNMNPRVVTRLFEAAKRADLAAQIGAMNRASPTDANALQLNRTGVATGLVSTPNRYMHSPVEMISLDDLDQGATLLAEFVRGLTPDADFTP